MKERLAIEPSKDIMLKVCRLTYMLIDNFIENEEQREELFELVDKATEELQGIEG